MKKGTNQLRERKDFHPTTSGHCPSAFAPTRKNGWNLDQFRLNPAKSGLKIKIFRNPGMFRLLGIASYPHASPPQKIKPNKGQ